MFVIFLVFKRKTEGILGNKFVLPTAIVMLFLVFAAVKRPVADYYKSIFKEAPYEFSELKSIVFRYGDNDNLINRYNSASGDFQYLDKRDSLIKSKVYLTSNDLLYLYRKATEAGFWDFPDNEINSDTTNTNGLKPPRYSTEFIFLHHRKKVIFDATYQGPQKLIEANRLLITEIQNVLKEARDRQKK